MALRLHFFLQGEGTPPAWQIPRTKAKLQKLPFLATSPPLGKMTEKLQITVFFGVILELFSNLSLISNGWQERALLSFFPILGGFAMPGWFPRQSRMDGTNLCCIKKSGPEGPRCYPEHGASTSATQSSPVALLVMIALLVPTKAVNPSTYSRPIHFRPARRGKMARKPHFGAIFPIFRSFFLNRLTRRESIFRPFFPISARSGSVPSQHD